MDGSSPVVVDEPRLEREPDGPGEPRPAGTLAGTVARWLPAVAVVVLTLLVLQFYAVPLTTSVRFGAYVALGVVLPGTLVWRALHRGAGWLVADLAAGLTLGYAGEVLVYIPARYLGAPLLVLLWPLGTVAAFLAVPGLRRYWRGSPDRERAPLWWNWTISGAAALLTVWSCKFFREYGLSWPGNSAPDTDSTFHLALIGEAKHHVPMTIPWASGEPLYYHWFVYTEMAATSWVTGIEPQVLLLRLSALPMMVGAMVLVAVLARKLFRHWWTGPVAVALYLFTLAPDPYRWRLNVFYTNLAFNAIDDGSSLRLTAWTSPTQTFGLVIFLGTVLALVDLLRGHGRDWRRWVAFAALSVALMGAKATCLPLLLAGLLVLLAGHLLLRRELHRPALAAAGTVLVCVVFAQLVLFDGASQGLHWQPGFTASTSGIGGTTGFTGDPRAWRLAFLMCIAAWCWVCMWAGVSGLVRGRRFADPVMLLFLGVGAAGIGGTALLGQAGDGQGFFIQSARPFLALAATGGLAAVLRDGRLTRRAGLLLLGAAATGVVAITAVTLLGQNRVPTIGSAGRAGKLAVQLAWPYLLLVAVAVLFWGALVVARRRVPLLRGLTHALVIALLAGFGLSTALYNYERVARDSVKDGFRNVVNGQPLVSQGTLEAGRWLRDHSNPDDLVATNAHCLLVWPDQPCTNLHFSLAAYSERRMLVEGWGFSTQAHELSAEQGIWDGYVKYWKPEVLADNDAAFTSPSTGTVDLLRDRYGVHWLFVDESQSTVSPRLGDFATLRFRSGDCAIYEIPSAGP